MRCVRKPLCLGAYGSVNEPGCKSFFSKEGGSPIVLLQFVTVVEQLACDG